MPFGKVVVVIVSGGGVTVRVVPPVTPESKAEIVVFPAELPVASPEELIWATAVLEDAHVTWVVMFDVLPSE